METINEPTFQLIEGGHEDLPESLAVVRLARESGIPGACLYSVLNQPDFVKRNAGDALVSVEASNVLCRRQLNLETFAFSATPDGDIVDSPLCGANLNSWDFVQQGKAARAFDEQRGVGILTYQPNPGGEIHGYQARGLRVKRFTFSVPMGRYWIDESDQFTGQLLDTLDTNRNGIFSALHAAARNVALKATTGNSHWDLSRFCPQYHPDRTRALGQKTLVIHEIMRRPFSSSCIGCATLMQVSLIPDARGHRAVDFSAVGIDYTVNEKDLNTSHNFTVAPPAMTST